MPMDHSESLGWIFIGLMSLLSPWLLFPTMVSVACPNPWSCIPHLYTAGSGLC